MEPGEFVILPNRVHRDDSRPDTFGYIFEYGVQAHGLTHTRRVFDIRVSNLNRLDDPARRLLV
jgi:hypothetical protein